VRRKIASVQPNAVFLNIPYDPKFRSLYLPMPISLGSFISALSRV